MGGFIAFILGCVVLRILFSAFKDMTKAWLKMAGALFLIILIICCIL